MWLHADRAVGHIEHSSRYLLDEAEVDVVHKMVDLRQLLAAVVAEGELRIRIPPLCDCGRVDALLPQCACNVELAKHLRDRNPAPQTSGMQGSGTAVPCPMQAADLSVYGAGSVGAEQEVQRLAVMLGVTQTAPLTTPMLPVTEVGCATILDAGAAM